jgi:PAS domain S-box-containing protein
VISFPTAVRYLVAVGLTAVAVALRVVLSPLFGEHVPYLTLVPAVLGASWFGGAGPGLLATALSVLAAWYFFLPPARFALPAAGDIVSLALFGATGAGIAWLNHALRAAAMLAHARAERLDAIINTTVDAIIVIDARGIIEAFNPAAERMFGYPAAEVLGRNVSLLMPSPHHEEHDGYLQRYAATGEAKVIGIGREFSGRRRDGTLFPVNLSVGEMLIEGQRKFTGLLHDLTARTRLESQLRASEARWRAIIDSAVDGIVVIDAQGLVESFNPGAERLFGYSEAEVIGRNVSMLMPSPYREEHDGYIARYLATGRAKIIGIGREVTAQRKDGTTFPVRLSVAEINIAGERKFTGILHDLSARMRMEDLLREQTALARLGEMAGLIAHEVKNPLAGIRGAIQVVGSRMAPDAPDGAILKEIISRIDSLDRMMKDLLLFARPPSPKRLATDVGALIASTAALLGQDPSLQAVDVEVVGSAPPVPADADMLKIVFQNLLINSGHAMQGSGRIRVVLRAAEGMVHIAFTDSGPGIPAEIREKIFVPFFTTKSRGTGLGLPTAKRLIEAHDGQISIDSPPAGGTTVNIFLPREIPA